MSDFFNDGMIFGVHWYTVSLAVVPIILLAGFGEFMARWINKCIQDADRIMKNKNKRK